jgi:conjugative transposon TraK protein
MIVIKNQKMEFRILRNIENSFKQIRLYAFLFAGFCLCVSLFVIWKSYQYAEAQRQKIYVLDKGKSLMLALSQDAKINRPVQAREHVRRFHELFFTLAPDKTAIESNMKRAFLLSDQSAFNYYKDLAEKGYYNRIISGNVQQRIEIDSIQCQFDSYPYAVKTFARQFITRSSSITERSLVTSCFLINSVSSDANPEGFTIEKFNVLENKDLQTVDR